MAYIGNAKTPLLYASNVRDDILPGQQVDGVSTKVLFDLSQEVPGGDESNITVLRRKYTRDVLVESSDLIDVSGGTITIDDNYLAAALGVIQPKSSNYEGDLLYITYENGTKSANYTVNSVLYNRDSVVITLDTLNMEAPTSVVKGSESISLTRAFYNAWEILDPKTDYSIAGDFGTPKYHKQIILKEAPQIDDIVYALHRGDATYNFVPSPASVDLAQLSPDLKNFRCDRYVGDGTTHTFTLSQQAANAKGLLVTVNGIVAESYDNFNTPVINGEWNLSNFVDGVQTITFHDPQDASTPQAPAIGAKIRVLHLGFVSKSQRAAFAPGQEPSQPRPGSIGQVELKDGSVVERKIDALAVTTSKIKDDAVTESKILLDATTNEGIRAKYSDGSTTKLVSVANDGSTNISSKTNKVDINFSGQVGLSVSTVSVEPGSTQTGMSLGTPSNKFTSLDLSSNASVGGSLSVASGAQITGATSVSGILSTSGIATLQSDVNVGGNIGMLNGFTVDGVDVSALKSAFDLLVKKVDALVPVGTIQMWTSTTLPQKENTTDQNWLVCAGDSIPREDYPTLFQIIGTTFGSLDSNSFSLPDLRRRVPVGRGATLVNGNDTFDVIGSNEGITTHTSRKITHIHSGAPHTHNLSGHTHGIPGHRHDIVSNESTLSISVNSGSHTTDLTHNHGSVTSGNPSTDLSHTHNLTHGHGSASSKYTSDSGGVDHTHPCSGTVTAYGSGTTSDTTVTHHIRANGSGDGAFNDTDKFTDARALSADGSGTSPRVRKTTSVAHSHPFGVTVSGSMSGATTGASATAHTHTFFIQSQTDTSANPNAGNSLSHTHTTIIPNFVNNSSSTGIHTHPSTAFSGFIGRASALSGNNDGVLNSGLPDKDYTGAATEGDTGESVSPYMIVNFIIKAKNG